MNKLLTTIVGAVLGTTMAVGVGVAAVNSANKETTKTEAVESVITFTPGTDTGTTTVTKNGVTVELTTMNNSSYYQIYANSTGTFSCSTGSIKKIEFSCTASGTTKYGPGNTTANVGSYSYSGSTGTWTGDAQSISLTSTAQVRMTSLSVTYDNGQQQADPTLTVSPTSAVVSKNNFVALTATPENGSGNVSWVSDDTSIATVGTPSGTSNKNVSVTGVSRGKTTITASYSTATPVHVSITVVDPQNAGTEAEPYTVEDARDHLDLIDGITIVYATGIVSEIVEEYNSQYGNITYNISTDGLTTSEQLEVYRGKSYNGDNFSSADDIQVGDVVVVYGTLQKHNSTYEFTANSHLVSLNRPF